MSKYLLVLTAFILSGCGSVSTSHRPNSYYHSVNSHSNNDPLFGETNETLVDKDIERILQHKLALPLESRIAILKLSGQGDWNGYSRDFNQLTQSIATGFIERIKQSPRVYDASFLPAMLVPRKRTIPYLREAAARYQADLLLAYRSNCYSFEKYKFIDPDETKAYCSVEVILLDVRTGIVPFTSISSNEFSARESKKDTNFRETIKKAELEAISKSLQESAKQLVTFIAEIDSI